MSQTARQTTQNDLNGQLNGKKDTRKNQYLNSNADGSQSARGDQQSRPKSQQQEDLFKVKKPQAEKRAKDRIDEALLKPSEKYTMDEKDVEIEHLRTQLAIYMDKAKVVEDLQLQVKQLQQQLDA